MVELTGLHGYGHNVPLLECVYPKLACHHTAISVCLGPLNFCIQEQLSTGTHLY